MLLNLVRRSSKPTQVFYSGDVLGESMIEIDEQIGSRVEYNYEVRITRGIVALL